MKAIILAAGKGRRMGSLGEVLPKCMLPLGNKVILAHLIDSLNAAGVNDIVVVGGYKANDLRDFLGESHTFIENKLYETTNSLYSLWLACEEMRGHDCIIFNSDVLFDPELLKHFIDYPVSTSCLVDETRPFDSNEFNIVLEDGKIIAYKNM